MGKILVTGASGNVGRAVVQSLLSKGALVKSAVFKFKSELDQRGDEKVLFNFADSKTYGPAFEGVDQLFLMRPPQISDVKKYLFPVIDFALEQGVRQIVFLSLQGVQFNIFTPHFKVEKYLRKLRAPFTFIRPNFYMQNLVTFYKEDIRERSEIFLPAGNGRMAFVDVRDVGEIAAKILMEDGHLGNAYTVSGPESLNYIQVASILSDVLGKTVKFANPSVKEYVKRMRDQGADEEFISVQKMLYFVVRHNFSASTQSDAETLLGRKPRSLLQFAEDYKRFWV